MGINFRQNWDGSLVLVKTGGNEKGQQKQKKTSKMTHLKFKLLST